MTDQTEIPALDIHYAMSTGALHTVVQFAEISLRIALQSEFTDNKFYLRREMEDVLQQLQRGLRDQKARDAVQDTRWNRAAS